MADSLGSGLTIIKEILSTINRRQVSRDEEERIRQITREVMMEKSNSAAENLLLQQMMNVLESNVGRQEAELQATTRERDRYRNQVEELNRGMEQLMKTKNQQQSGDGSGLTPRQRRLAEMYEELKGMRDGRREHGPQNFRGRGRGGGEYRRPHYQAQGAASKFNRPDNSPFHPGNKPHFQNKDGFEVVDYKDCQPGHHASNQNFGNRGGRGGYHPQDQKPMRGTFQHRGQFHNRGQFQHHRGQTHQHRGGFHNRGPGQASAGSADLSQFSMGEVEAIKVLLKQQQTQKHQQQQTQKHQQQQVQKKNTQEKGAPNKPAFKKPHKKKSAGATNVAGAAKNEKDDSEDDDSTSSDDGDDEEEKVGAKKPAMKENETTSSEQGTQSGAKKKKKNVKQNKKVLSVEQQTKDSTPVDLFVASGFDLSNSSKLNPQDRLKDVLLIAKEDGKMITCQPNTVGELLEFTRQYPNAQPIIAKDKNEN